MSQATEAQAEQFPGRGVNCHVHVAGDDREAFVPVVGAGVGERAFAEHRIVDRVVGDVVTERLRDTSKALAAHRDDGGAGGAAKND